MKNKKMLPKPSPESITTIAPRKLLASKVKPSASRDILVSALLQDLAQVCNEILGDSLDDDIAEATLMEILNVTSILELHPKLEGDSRAAITLALYVMLSEYYRLYVGNLHPQVAEYLKDIGEKTLN